MIYLWLKQEGEQGCQDIPGKKARGKITEVGFVTGRQDSHHLTFPSYKDGQHASATLPSLPSLLHQPPPARMSPREQRSVSSLLLFASSSHTTITFWKPQGVFHHGPHSGAGTRDWIGAHISIDLNDRDTIRVPQCFSNCNEVRTLHLVLSQ